MVRSHQVGKKSGQGNIRLREVGPQGEEGRRLTYPILFVGLTLAVFRVLWQRIRRRIETEEEFAWVRPYLPDNGALVIGGIVEGELHEEPSSNPSI